MANHKRPEDRHSTNVTIRFKAAQLDRIDKEAEEQNTTRSNIVRDMVDAKIFPHEIED